MQNCSIQRLMHLEKQQLAMYKTPKLTVVGAGPGDVDLITLKAIKVLKTADVVLYDALIQSLYIGFLYVAIISHYGAHGVLFDPIIIDKKAKYRQGILL